MAGAPRRGAGAIYLPMLCKTLTILLLLCCSIARAGVPSAPLAPGYSDLGYPVPQPGSYQVPPVAMAADGEVVDSEGKTLRLHELFGDRYVLLSFMYTNCGDTNGCPLTAHVFYQLQRIMAQDSVLAQNLRLVSLSFDPQHDTPEMMKLYASNFTRNGESGENDEGGQWRFATTRSERQLAPILQAYGQDMQRKLAIGGGAGAGFFHVLRVFLIDPQRRVRNIYSVSFLHTDLILADLNTLLLEEGGAAESVDIYSAVTGTGLDGRGDRRGGYESVAYNTHSLDLQNRKGQAADL
ncbi:MAG: photosynthetic protein synthase I, partial [Gammaproteobacteria bacterium]